MTLLMWKDKVICNVLDLNFSPSLSPKGKKESERRSDAKISQLERERERERE